MMYDPNGRRNQENPYPYPRPAHPPWGPVPGRPIIIPIQIRPPIGRLPWGLGPVHPPWGLPWYPGRPDRPDRPNRMP